MITIEATHEGVKKNLSIKEWSLISGASCQKIRGRSQSKNKLSNEYVVCLEEDENSVLKKHRVNDEKMCSLYLSGFTIRAIGEKFNVSYQRVQQILKRNSLTWLDSVKHKETQIKKAAYRDKIEAKIIKSYMCTRAQLRVYRAMHADYKKTPLLKYKQQKRNAMLRGIDWDFTINSWWRVWDESGKWNKMGRCLGEYVMARHGDIGPYSPSNVYITTCSDNISSGYAFRK